MGTNHSLDTLTGRELKEMILRGEILPENLSIGALKTLFDYETDVVCCVGGDDALLCRCADLLAEKEGRNEAQDEKYREMLRAALDSVTEHGDAEKERTVRKTFRFRKLLIAAAAFVTLACSATVIATAFGFDVVSYFREVIGMPVGTELDVGPVTFVHLGEPKKYDSIEELLKQEQLNILFPAEMPEGISVTSVQISEMQNGNDLIEILTNDENTFIQIDLSASKPEDDFTDADIHTINGIVFYTRSERNSAVCYFEGNYYSIRANSYDNLLLIINHMKI